MALRLLQELSPAAVRGSECSGADFLPPCAEEPHAPSPALAPLCPLGQCQGFRGLQMCTAIHRENKHGDHHPPFPQEPVDRKYTRTTAEGLKAEGLHRCWDTRVTGYCDGYCGATNGVNRAPGDFPAIALT